MVIGWVLLALAIFVGASGFADPYFGIITRMVTLVTGLFLAIIAIARIIRVMRKKGSGLLLLLAGIPVIMILFIIPYVLWGLEHSS